MRPVISVGKPFRFPLPEGGSYSPPLMKRLSLTLCLALSFATLLRAAPTSWSGIYPHLASFNDEDECGTGAIVPWAGKLWFLTYAPHSPFGSSDKLYSVSPELALTIHPESIGGTPANRMIHKESEQLFIGPYAIGKNGKVRAISYEKMPGRPTGNARHLTDPAGKLYYASMEEGLYEVDVKTLEVKTLYRDNHLDSGKRAAQTDASSARLPGYHGKGLYSGQGVLVYANNGEKGKGAMTNPFTASGCLAEWNGVDWKVIRRTQFTEVTGPGGITGNANPATDPIWSIGWDARSLLLMVREEGQWHTFRLPKASHTYDGAHGWNTEWPRIRDIGEEDFLMTMHGMFWRFPKNFSSKNTSGLAPRSSYLKVVGDFCRWQDRIVLGCDDATKSVFSNHRKAKDPIADTQSQSNLWFLRPEQLDQLGPVSARGGVWLKDDVKRGTISEPMLLNGFARRSVQLTHEGDRPAVITVQVKRDGTWEKVQSTMIKPGAATLLDLTECSAGCNWVRVRAESTIKGATAWFSLSNPDKRELLSDELFNGLAQPTHKSVTGGIIRPRGENKRTLHYAALTSGEEGPVDLGYYELGSDMKLRRVEDPETHKWLKEKNAIVTGHLSADEGSVIFVNDQGQRYRLPRSSTEFKASGLLGPERLDREVATERDLFNAFGILYELPADNAGGFGRIRPIATHGRRISDFCSYRGLLVLSGLSTEAPADNKHIIRSDDGKTALWVGAIDDLWRLGKPHGTGGPWKRSQVKAGEPSDPFLIGGFDLRLLSLLHNSPDRKAVTFTIEFDLDGTGFWKPFKEFTLPSGSAMTYRFPDLFQAYWIRFVANGETTATATLSYN